MADAQQAVQQNEFLIRTEIQPDDQVDVRAIELAIQSLGGLETDHGFCFISAQDRAAAVEVLGEKFGSRYFAVVDVPDR